jgi:hypothetical protein
MLSFKRQVCYWALSLAAVTIFKLLENFVVSRNWAADAISWLALIVIVAASVLQEAHSVGYAHEYEEALVNTNMNEAEIPNHRVWQPPRQFTYYAVLGAAMVSLGYASPLVQNLFATRIFTSPKLVPWITNEHLHTMTAYILLAEAEYWRNGTPDVYLHKPPFFGRDELCHPTTPNRSAFTLLLLSPITAYLAAPLMDVSHSHGVRSLLELILFLILLSPQLAILWRVKDVASQWVNIEVRRS